MIQWLARLRWYFIHRHGWRCVGVGSLGGQSLVKQRCRVFGCGAMRITHDDGREAGFSVRLGIAKVESAGMTIWRDPVKPSHDWRPGGA